jgi:hypothetical protein
MEDWKSVGRQWRPAPFWSWNDKLQEGELRRQIREMAEKGWGGYFMHSRVGLVTGYLSEDWMSLVRACADEARATNTWAWLYDEDKWPSGFASGEVPKADPAFRVRWLVLRKAGEVPQEDEVLMEIADQGIQYAICRRVSPLDSLWFNSASYVDLMNPEAVKFFIKCTHERYKQAVGEYFGKEIPGIFTDEPAYTYPTREPFVPWSDYLPDYFRSLKGYDIVGKVDQLFFERGDYRKTRFDFYDAATRLFRDSFTKQYYEWCENNGLLMTGHFMAEDNLQSQTAWVGAAMPHYAYMHWPGIDKLGRHLEQIVTVRQLSSAVEQLGKERAFCEVFGCIGQHSSFPERKWIADWEAVLGIGYVNHHLSLYSMRGERKRDYPANLFYQQPWWDDERGFADYIARLSKAATEGKRDVNIMIIHPIASFWAEYSPLHAKAHNMPELAAYDQPFQTLSRRLCEEKLDYHYGDEILIEENGSVVGDQLRIGQHSYGVVVVPPSLTLRANTWKLLREFAEAGGKLVFVRPTPSLADATQGAPDLPASAVVVDSVDAAVSTLDGLCEQRVRVQDLVAGREARSVFLCVRDVESTRRILMANTDNRRELRAKASIPLVTCDGKAMTSPQITAIDLTDGSSHRVQFESSDGNAVLQMRMAPVGSVLLVLSEGECESAGKGGGEGKGACACSCGSTPVFLGSGAAIGPEAPQAVLAGSVTFDVEVLDENVLPLEKVSLWLNGDQVLSDAPIAQAWHDHFYVAAEGTPFRAEYSFEIGSVPANGVTAVIEVAENLDRISLNGIEVSPLKRRDESAPFDPSMSWKDPNFTRVPIPVTALRTGINTLTIEGKKSNNITKAGCHSRVDNYREHTPTEVEVVYIVGDFVVGSFDDTDFHICDPKAPCGVCAQRKVDPFDLSRSGYPFYAGRARFTTTLSMPEAAGATDGRVLLSVGSAHAASITARVNGAPAGTMYWTPYAVDVTHLLKPGDNRIELEAATTLFNCFGPGWIHNIVEDQYISPYTFVDLGRYTEKRRLLPFGIGEARLSRV